ncbi:uncharacterized protein M421DRAFT_90207 [Didymella exigua CBS 183.55]|uniref:Uncharacterized protein n=1 Tax=Didymella exigua CBS 183.55 TaxID=1150837 RepID=A0A6A5RRQ0_9PLEO|nr:uncharacterized protein M421DRAFT_90207 [Didymella exigua CBS 183.55]KAF1931111.1 hypothetical protein M421DRAFT_90207 [Didymella exigua CBS 183.55]
MSCLPLFSFGPSKSSAYKPSDRSKPDAQCLPSRPMMPETAHLNEGVYDKLAQVSVSHRRLDSFEWVLTQSAPNTPPTSDSTSSKAFSPPPGRFITSAPLPVPDELWSYSQHAKGGKQQQGYFDWWPSPSLVNCNGYAMIPDDEEHYDRYALAARQSNTDSSRSRAIGVRTCKESRSHAAPALGGNDRLRPSQNLSALGIVLPDSPPPNPPMPKVSKTSEPHVAPGTSSRASPSRLPKRVTFSPVIDELTLASFSDLNEQSSSSWGSYLPSSFLVARAPLSRTTSLPPKQANIIVRPILRRSTSSDAQPTRITEMVQLPPSAGCKNKGNVTSPMPAQRLSVSQSPIIGNPRRDSSDKEKVFVSLLHASHIDDSMILL